MDLRRARTFVTVADVGTVSAAAQQLHIAQPALSRQIYDLEEELGLKLFDRVGRRLLLTSDGEQLLGDCRVLLNYASALGEHAKLLRHGDVGILKVAASAPLIENVLPGFLHRYAKRFPDVQVKLIDARGSTLLAMLSRGDIHFGECIEHSVQTDDPRFESLVLHPIEMLATWHPRLSVDGGRSIEVHRLAQYPLLLPDSGTVFREIFDSAFRPAGVKPNILLESRSTHSLLKMAEAGHGVAIIPSTLRMRGSALRIAAVTYRGEPLRVPLVVLWDKRRPRTRYGAAFCEMLARYTREVLPIACPTAPKRRGKGQRTKACRVCK